MESPVMSPHPRTGVHATRLSFRVSEEISKRQAVMKASPLPSSPKDFSTLGSGAHGRLFWGGFEGLGLGIHSFLFRFH